MFVPLNLLLKYSVEYNQLIQQDLTEAHKNERPQPNKTKNSDRDDNNEKNSGTRSDNKQLKIKKSKVESVSQEQRKKKSDKKQTRKVNNRMQLQDKGKQQNQKETQKKKPISSEYQSYRPNSLKNVRSSITPNRSAPRNTSNDHLDTHHIAHEMKRNDDDHYHYNHHSSSPREHDRYSTDRSRQSTYDSNKKNGHNNDSFSEKGSFRYSQVTNKKDIKLPVDSLSRFKPDPREGRQSEYHDY